MWNHRRPIHLRWIVRRLPSMWVCGLSSCCYSFCAALIASYLNYAFYRCRDFFLFVAEIGIDNTKNLFRCAVIVLLRDACCCADHAAFERRMTDQPSNEINQSFHRCIRVPVRTYSSFAGQNPEPTIVMVPIVYQHSDYYSS